MREMNKEPSNEVDEEVKKKRIFEQNAKCKLMMLIDVMTGGETNEYFWATGGNRGVQEAQRREMS